MANEKVNKVVLGSETLVDLTDATASADKILLGYTAYGSDGNKLTGTADVKGDTIIIVNYDDEFKGQTITCSKSGTTYTKTAPSNKNEVRFYPTSTGEWDITCTLDGELYETSATIFTLDDIVECELEYLVDGSTVLPINDVPTWLKCAKLESLGYTTLAQVIEDTDTLEALLGDSNACAYLVRSTGFAKAVGQVPVMTGYTTPSGMAFANSVYDNRYGWWAFDGTKATSFTDSWCANNVLPAWVGYIFDTAKVIRSVYWYMPYDVYYPFTPKTYKIQGSNDTTDGSDGNWVDLTDSISTTSASDDEHKISFENDTAYKAYRMYITATWRNGSNYVGVGTLQFYSIDADFATNEQAMTILGKYDYACNVLLADATWAEAIIKSAYVDSVCDISVPKMTSNATPRGVAFSSTPYSSSYPAWYAFDKTYTTAWASVQSSPLYLGYDFSEPVKISGIMMQGRSGYSDLVGSFKVQGSNTSISDGYVDLTDTLQNLNKGGGSKNYHVIDNNTAYRYIRIYSSDWTLGNTVGELQFYGRHSASLVPLVPTMTSDTTPSGEVSASVENISGAYPYYAFDGQGGDGSSNVQHYWSDNTVATFVSPCYLQYTFPTAKVAKKVRLVSRWANYCYPKDFTIYGSNDGGITKATLLTVSNHSISEYVFESDLDNNTAYTTYGINITSSNAGNMAINVLQFYGYEPTVDLIHSAPYDTIYYLDNGVEVPVTTTDINGIGEIDYSNLPQGDVTLYSSVAKDLADLSKNYRKTIKNTPNRVESWLMPILNNLYWFGWGETIIPTLYSSKTSSYALSSGTTSAKNTNDTTLQNSTYPNTCALWQYRIIDLTNVTTIKALLKDMSRFSGTNTFISIRVFPLSNIQSNGSIYVDNAILGQYSTQHSGAEDYEEWVSLNVSSLSGEYIVGVGGSSNGSGRTVISNKCSAFLYVKE